MLFFSFLSLFSLSLSRWRASAVRGGMDHSFGAGLVWSSRRGEMVVELNPLGGGKVPRNRSRGRMEWHGMILSYKTNSDIYNPAEVCASFSPFPSLSPVAPRGSSVSCWLAVLTVSGISAHSTPGFGISGFWSISINPSRTHACCLWICCITPVLLDSAKSCPGMMRGIGMGWCTGTGYPDPSPPVS